MKRPYTLRRLKSFLAPDLSRPVFVLGAPRSGTTFLGACLAALPEISYHFEPIATKAAVRYVYHGIWSEPAAKRFFRRTYRRLMQFHVDGDLRFAEKTPRNCLIVSFLRRCFPSAAFLHVIRDGRDAALSLSRQPWFQAASAAPTRRSPGQDPSGPFPRFWVEPQRAAEFQAVSTIRRCAWVWRRHVEAVLTTAAELPRAGYLEVRYEDLAAARSEVAARVIDFLGITDAQSAARFRRELGTARAESVGRWRSELSEDQIHEILAEAGACLARLRYVNVPKNHTSGKGDADA